MLARLRTVHGNFSEQKISSEDVAMILETAPRAANEETNFAPGEAPELI